MKSLKKFAFVLLLTCIITLLFSNIMSYAENPVIEPRTIDEAVTTSEEPGEGTVSSSNEHLEDLYLLNSSITIDYPVNGNVFRRIL